MAPARSRIAGTLLLATPIVASAMCLADLWGLHDGLQDLASPSVWPNDRLAVRWFVWSVVLACLSPGLALGVVLARRWGRAGVVGWCTVTALVGAALVVDATVYGVFGLHLANVADVITSPEAVGMAGGAGVWTRLIVVAISKALVIAAASMGVAHCVLALARRNTLLMSRPARIAVGAGALLALAAPVWLRRTIHDPLITQRAWLAMAIEPLVPAPPDLNPALRDPEVRKVAQAVQAQFARLYTRLVAPAPPDPSAAIDPANRLDVVLVAVESLRPEAIFGDVPWMPRVAAWARRGLRFERHDAATNYSECGLFALLQARSPLFYDATVAQDVPPQALFTLRRSGYRTTYSASLASAWRGQERFMSKRFFDEVIIPPDAVVDWPARDRAALAVLRSLPSGERPVFAMAFLHSSHFGYYFPDDYVRLRPVLDLASLHESSQLRSEMREPLLNRYRNSLEFEDDLIADFIESLDARRTIIVVVGDHGEAFGEGGMFGHAYALAESATRTPMAIVGPGVPAQDVAYETRHVDVFPTLLRLLDGHGVPLAHVNGRDALVPPEAASPRILSNRKQLVVVRDGQRLAFDVDWERRQIVVKGFEDDGGRPAAARPIDDWHRWAQAVVGELEAVLR